MSQGQGHRRKDLPLCLTVAYLVGFQVSKHIFLDMDHIIVRCDVLGWTGKVVEGRYWLKLVK